ncbi:hypothetical protein GJAV_G00109720 [Gymnothorax javanicus]|nr:hypothetical protein GJAV_G00109720 [Gymnothorax javanicus]
MACEDVEEKRSLVVMSDLGMTRTALNTVTQREQDTFGQCVESALSWIRSVQERLTASDNTAGPFAALQARLEETEVLHHSNMKDG